MTHALPNDGVVSHRLDVMPVQWNQPKSFEVGFNHEKDELLKGDGWLPAELLACFGCIANQEFNFSRAQIAIVKLDVITPIELDVAKRNIQKLFHRVGFTRG